MKWKASSKRTIRTRTPCFNSTFLRPQPPFWSHQPAFLSIPAVSSFSASDHHPVSACSSAMYTSLWLCFFVIFLRSLNVQSVSVPETDVPREAQLTAAGTTTTSSSTPTPTPIASIPSYATRFTHRPPESLISGTHAKRWLANARRKIEFFIRWIMASVVPDIRPTREDFLYLRSLEDPVFMSVTELPPTITGVPPQPRSQVLEGKEASNIRRILRSLETELEKRSSSERKCIAEDLDQIFKRNVDTEQSLESLETMD